MPLRFPYSTRRCILLLALAFWPKLYSETLGGKNLRGIPYYNFFTTGDFDSGASSVFVTTAADGTIFYGDQSWIHLYDGAHWHKVYQNSNTSKKITSLLWDPDGKVYAAGFSLFGEFLVDENNTPAFHSLIPKDAFRNGEAIEKIESTPQAVYLTGWHSFACYDKQTGSMDLHMLSTWITATFLLDGIPHVLTDDNDMFLYHEGTFSKLPEISSLLHESGITVADIEIDDDGNIVMASERRGIFKYDGKTLSRAYPHFTPSPDNITTDIARISQNRLVVASLGGGIAVIDKEGNTIEALGPEVDYRFQSARALNIDHSGTVWALFNNTLAKILLDSPLSAIDERIRPSFYYASQYLHGGELYVRSYSILYKAIFDAKGRISGFVNALPDSDLEIWSVATTDDALYLNTANNGIFKLENGSPQFLVESEAYNQFEHSKQAPQFLLGANSDSFALYERTDSKLRLVERIDNPHGFINRLHEDASGAFWIEYGLGKTGQVKIVDKHLKLTVFAEDYGIPKDQWCTLWIHNGIPYLNTSNETLELDPSQKPFKVAPPLQGAIESDRHGIGRAFTDPDGNVWNSTNNKNIIYWKQADGSYLRDETSLSEMGEPYFESIKFLDNGDALIMTSFEFFHFRGPKAPSAEDSNSLATKIIRIEDPKDEDRLFTELGTPKSPPSLTLSYPHNNLEFTVANTFTYTTLPPLFQFRLEGFSDQSITQDELSWSKSSKVSYTNLQPGKYTFKARTKLGNGSIGPWVQLAIKIRPPIYSTLPAYIIYGCVSFLLILFIAKLNSSRLTRQNLELEEKVKSRTQEIERKNAELEQQANLLEQKNVELQSQSAELQQNASELEEALVQLNDTQDKLLTTARIAGRAEVATNVLHSVGNVLNSINIGLQNLDKQIVQSRAQNLKAVVQLIKANESDLSHFFQTDDRGKQIPSYLDQLAESLRKELESYSQRIQEIDTNVEHIKKIIATQQTHAKRVGVEQEVHIAELLESALAVTLGESYEKTHPIERDYDWDLVCSTDKHLVLDVVINLIKNAKDSLSNLPPNQRLISLACRSDNANSISITITDNGSGIDNSDHAKLFTHGFTTKPTGHGFGLHGSANAIKSIGGSLKLESPGLGKGATATITLPL